MQQIAKRSSNSLFFRSGPVRTRSAACLAVGCLVLFTGCNNWPSLRNSSMMGSNQRVPSATPTSAELVSYLNDNARRLQSIQCQDLQLDASQRLQSIGLTGHLVCQKSKNFRMVANVGGNTMVDMGSNDQEFWYWITKDNPPYLYHCSHQDFAQGRARMPFPFQPEWVMEALGMAEYDPAKNYQVEVRGNSIELSEQTVGPGGRPVTKVTVFSRGPNPVQVTGHYLRDAAGKDICSAQIAEVQQDRASGAIYPRRVKLAWPAEQMKLQMKLDSVTINAPIQGEAVTRLFSRPNYKDVQTFDLARGLDAPGDTVRRAGGLYR